MFTPTPIPMQIFDGYSNTQTALGNYQVTRCVAKRYYSVANTIQVCILLGGCSQVFAMAMRFGLGSGSPFHLNRPRNSLPNRLGMYLARIYPGEIKRPNKGVCYPNFSFTYPRADAVIVIATPFGGTIGLRRYTNLCFFGMLFFDNDGFHE